MEESHVAFRNINSLPPEILLQIFKKCQLKDLLRLSRVCRSFRLLISQILQKRYPDFMLQGIFHFSLFFEVNNHGSVPTTDILQRFLSVLDVEKHTKIAKFAASVQSLIDFINNPLLPEMTPNLGDVSITDSLQRLRNLVAKMSEVGNFPEPAILKATVQALIKKIIRCIPEFTQNNDNVSYADILQSLHSSQVLEFVRLVLHLISLTTLRLAALPQDPAFLRAILSLPLLTSLQFFWLGTKAPLQFKENLFEELHKNSKKSLSLTCLIFENCHFDMGIGHQSLQWTDEVFEKISKALESSILLESLIFRNCHPLSYDQLKKLSEINRHLKFIKICGRTENEDQQFIKQWKGGNRLRDDFQFIFDSVPNLNKVMKHQADDGLMGSIEFQFFE